VGVLALNHVSTRHPPRALRDEARSVFAPTVIPRDFDTIEIPLAERGEPTLVRWEAQAAAGARPGSAEPAASAQPGEGHRAAPAAPGEDQPAAAEAPG